MGADAELRRSSRSWAAASEARRCAIELSSGCRREAPCRNEALGLPAVVCMTHTRSRTPAELNLLVGAVLAVLDYRMSGKEAVRERLRRGGGRVRVGRTD